MKGWVQRIAEAKQRKRLGFLSWPGFTSDDRELASSWTTCAVGEVRKRYGARMDRTLGQLGVQFSRAVRWNRIDRASELREAIEEYALDGKRRQWERRKTAGAPSAARVTGVAFETPTIIQFHS